jgi:hypothetical protein
MTILVSIISLEKKWVKITLIVYIFLWCII